MAELIVSALLPALIDKLVSETSRTIGRYKGIGGEIKKWQRWLSQVKDVLTDASEKEITDDAVKEWLKDLQHLAYDIDDLFDGWATEAMHPKFTHTTSKVTKLIPTCCTNFSRSTTMLGELDSINVRFKDLVSRKNEFGLKGEGKPGLRVEGEPRPKNTKGRSQSSSVVDPSRIVGRQVEKEASVRQLLLLGDELCDQKYSVVPIVGMGGVGKTTLAKLLYNEEQVNDHFELMAWVCVSDDFDSFAISKVIFENVAGGNKIFADLNLLQVDLVKQLRGKRFLLVLDDVWSVSDGEWENLVEPFYVCAPGSKIIITTRKEQPLKSLGCDHLNQLHSLSDDYALSLIAKLALGVNNFDSHLSLKPHGEAIVTKCDGLPLALVVLGRLLGGKRSEGEHWKKVANDKIWALGDGGGILSALRISYHDLSACLKQLFAYCSLFPKDFLFDKEELVRLWMAEGFFPSSTPNDPTKESLGHTYFDELLSRSFFQHAPDNKSLFVMHDMMNDLATSVAGEFDNETEKGIKEETWKKHRHMSFVHDKYVTSKKFKTFEKAKNLRTFLTTSVGVPSSCTCFYLSDKILAEVLPKLPLLRVLSLSSFEISEVPESIGTLRHLRYLNLSRTEITQLPENVCTLYNLQTLMVFGCERLTKLPNDFLNLKNLQHFDISGTGLLKMPLGIGELKRLQTLSKIIIGGEGGFEIANLKQLDNLCGKISIVGLEKVQVAKHAQEANFSRKKLSELEVVWSGYSRNEVLEKEVLSQLKPHNDKLIQLTIRSYGGLEFPIWVGNPSFLHLKHVSIHHCERCTSLPPLGQLPSLKELFIEGLYRMEVVGMELFGDGLAFPSLEILSFKCMPQWKKWSTNSGVVFPCLQELHIESCGELVEVSIEALPSLKVLEIDSCDNGVLRKLVKVALAVIKLEIKIISGLNDVVWRGVMEHLKAVEELSIWMCNEIKYLWESEAIASKLLVKLRNLNVWCCDNLISLGEKEEEDDDCRSNLLTSIRTLTVHSCNNMERCSCPDSIETLRVDDCSSIKTISLPTGVQKLKSFEVKNCKKLLEREWEISNNRTNMAMLEYVAIDFWENLKSITKLKYLVHLTKLRIENCGSLESFPHSELPNLTSLKEMEITICPSMDASFPGGVWPPNLRSLKIGMLKKPISEWGTQNFPASLVKLELYGGEDEVSSCQFSDLLPSSLNHLCIVAFEKLESVSEGLQHLTSLQELLFVFCPNLKKVSCPQHLKRLFFYECPNMMDLPEEMLPSLLSLTIGINCPKLKERCSEKGRYRPLISYIPHVSI